MSPFFGSGGGFSGFFGGGFNPTALSVPLSLWLSTRYANSLYSDAGVTQANANDAIQQWSDLSGNGYHALQTNVAKKPILKTNQINGLPVVRFDGTDDTMQLASAINPLTNNISGFAMFIIWKSADAGTTQTPICFLNNSVATRVSVTKDTGNKDSTGGRRLDSDSNQVVTAATGPGTAYILTTSIVDYGNSDIFLYRNGSLVASSTSFQTSGNTSSTDSSAVHMGTFNGSSNFLNGDIAEILVFRGKPTDAERQSLERWLGGLYGVTVS